MNTDLFPSLVAKAHVAKTLAELAFVICNDTLALVPYRQAALIDLRGATPARVVAHSGLADVDADAPYSQWLVQVVRHFRDALAALPPGARVLALSADALPMALGDAWGDWLPAHALALGLAGPDEKLCAVLLLARAEPWPTELRPGTPGYMLARAAGVFGHAWWAMARRRPTLGARLAALPRAKLTRRLLVALAVLLLVPVREYALVPAEVVSNRTEVIASPRDGVIRQMTVKPNTPVTAGQTIAELDDTTLYNRLSVGRAALATARTELHQASQRAIETQEAKAELGLAEGRLKEREVDVESLGREMERLQIKAPAAGVFIYSDPDDWAGRPVQTGERVGLLADPGVLGLHAWAPVAEAVNLKPGAPVTLFLRVAPLSPVSGRIDYASYQVVDSPTGVASYLLRGTVTASDDNAHARIGLRGTARIAGDWTVLGYLLLRRPIAAAREWCGC
ncbi:efflux RND transporter periplasmic adaptor subunit [Variovorax rhizosphaerae]|uniref:HlyD family efflux transporter periplasmic adaptor subunit n=1 Tax=Variovorax rhizosphaerae TaxID=1836200 RepID=A0ABU8WC78_9BURK